MSRFRALAVLLLASSLLAITPLTQQEPASAQAEPLTVAARPPTVLRGAALRRDSVDCAKARCVALTFDDGPGEPTPRLLRILRQRKVRATFFVLGTRVDAMPGVARRIVADGHQIGNHSWGHARLTVLSPAALAAEISRTQQRVKRATGEWPSLLRPPYGETGGRVAAAAKRRGLPQVMWSVDPRDWADRQASVVTSRVLGSVSAGSIVLLHDIHPTTVDAVPRIIRGLRSRGYRLVTVSELLPRMRPGSVYRSR